MRKVSKIILVILITALSILLTSCTNTEKSTHNVIEPPDTSENPVEAFGVIKPCGTKVISIGIPAQITRLNAIEGQRVRRGDILATLDLTEYNGSIGSCESEIKIVERDLQLLRQNYGNDLKMLKEGSLPDMKKLMNSLDESRQVLLDAQEALELKKSLYATGSISKSELEEADTLIKLKESASRDIALSVESLKAAKMKELSSISSEITAKEDKLSALTAELADMKQKLNTGILQGNRLICDLGQGVVSNVLCSEGKNINSAESLFTIMDISNLTVEANVDEQFISTVKTGARVVIIPDADRSRLYTGKVYFISSLAVTLNGETTIPVHITIDDADSFLIPGLNVAVKIDTK